MKAEQPTIYRDGYMLYCLEGTWIAEAPDGTTARDSIKRGAELQIRHHRETGSFFDDN